MYCSFLLWPYARLYAQTDYLIIYNPPPFILALLASHHAQQDAPERDSPEGTAHLAQEQRTIEISWYLSSVHIACHAA